MAYTNSWLETLGYPADLHSSMYAIRRKEPEDVEDLLVAMMHEGAPPPHAVRLAGGQFFHILPTNKMMEIYGGVRNLPFFFKKGEGDTAVVNFVGGYVLLEWKEGEETHWVMMTPNPDRLREDAENLLRQMQDPNEQEMADVHTLLLLADWLERIPLAPAVSPDA